MNNNILIDSTKLPMLLRHNYIFIDLRNNNDFKREHLTKFVNIPYEQFDLNNPILKRNIPILLICYSGSKSLEIANLLNQNEYTAYCISGGMYAVTNPINNSIY